MKPEKKKNSKRQIMDDLMKKAIDAQNKEVKKAKREMLSTPRIPGVNRATVRKYIKQQTKVIKRQQRRDTLAGLKKAMIEENMKLFSGMAENEN